MEPEADRDSPPGAAPQSEPKSEGAEGAARRGNRSGARGSSRPGETDDRVGVGTILGGYRLERGLGQGGMGSVWLATRPSADPVAIKTINSDLAAYKNSDLAAYKEVENALRDEANHLMRITHQAIVRYFHFDVDPTLGVPYITMQYIDGENLGQKLDSLRPSRREIIDFGILVANGLADAHAQGRAHCDLKPKNIMLGGGKLANARVIDFGIGRKLGQGSRGDGVPGFSPGFAAPEQLQGGIEPDERADIFSLALVMLTLFNPELDMGIDEKAGLELRRAGAYDFSRVPLSVRPVLRSMLAFDRTKRTQTMNDVVRALTRRHRWYYRAFDWVGGWIGKVLRDRKERRAALIWGGGGLVAAAMLVTLLLLPSAPVDNIIVPPPDPVIEHQVETAPAPLAPLNVRAEATVTQALPSTACAWIDPHVDADGASVELTGAADQVVAVGEQLRGALQPAIRVAGTDGIVPLEAGDCDLVRAYRALRSSESNRLTLVGGARLHMRKGQDHPIPDGTLGGTTEYAEATVHLNFVNRPENFVLIAINDGEATLFYKSPRDFDDHLCKPDDPCRQCKPNVRCHSPLSALSVFGMYEQRVPMRFAGATGMILLTSDKAFPAGVDLVPPGGHWSAEWLSKFQAAAAPEAGNFKTEAVWFCVSPTSDDGPCR